MKKTLLISFLALGLGIGIYSITGASFVGFKNLFNMGTEKKVCITTSFGDIKIKLYDETPQHRDNFVKLVKAAYFDSILFHRVIKDFMIQGGDPDSKKADPNAILGNGGPSYTIPAEILVDTITSNTATGVKKTTIVKKFHKKGALGAARDNNPAKASSGSQFYIVQGKVYTEQQLASFAQRAGKTFSKEQIEAYTTIGGTPHLDGDYTVFGEVYEGMSIVDSIAAQKIGPYDRPVKDIRMTIKMIE